MQNSLQKYLVQQIRCYKTECTSYHLPSRFFRSKEVAFDQKERNRQKSQPDQQVGEHDGKIKAGEDDQSDAGDDVDSRTDNDAYFCRVTLDSLHGLLKQHHCSREKSDRKKADQRKRYHGLSEISLQKSLEASAVSAVPQTLRLSGNAGR